MFSVKIEGFKTKEQAEAFVNWYEGQGEQDITYWLEEHTYITSLNTNCATTFPLIWEENVLPMTVVPA